MRRSAVCIDDVSGKHADRANSQPGCTSRVSPLTRRLVRTRRCAGRKRITSVEWHGNIIYDVQRDDVSDLPPLHPPGVGLQAVVANPLKGGSH